jgi:hypothetical protein
MNRKIKALGLALVAGLAVMALVASLGHATEEEEWQNPKRFQTPAASADKPATVTGVHASTPTFTIGKKEVVCESAHLAGQMSAQEVPELTMTPSYGGCKTESLKVDFEFNGCDYLFTLTGGTVETPGEGTHTRGPLDIKCPPGKSIAIKVTLGGSTLCTITVPEQKPGEPEIDQKNIGTGFSREIQLTFTVKEVHYQVTGGFGGCGEIGKTLTDGAIHSVMRVASYENGTGKQQQLKVVGELDP